MGTDGTGSLRRHRGDGESAGDKDGARLAGDAAERTMHGRRIGTFAR